MPRVHSENTLLIDVRADCPSGRGSPGTSVAPERWTPFPRLAATIKQGGPVCAPSRARRRCSRSSSLYRRCGLGDCICQSPPDEYKGGHNAVRDGKATTCRSDAVAEVYKDFLCSTFLRTDPRAINPPIRVSAMHSSLHARSTRKAHDMQVTNIFAWRPCLSRYTFPASASQPHVPAPTTSLTTIHIAGALSHAPPANSIL